MNYFKLAITHFEKEISTLTKDELLKLQSELQEKVQNEFNYYEKGDIDLFKSQLGRVVKLLMHL